MQNKLKNQANKLRGAVNKTNAVKALGQSDEASVAPPGYDQVQNNDERLISRDDEIGNEDNRLIDDETLYQDLEENDPLLVQKRALTKAKIELDDYL